MIEMIATSTSTIRDTKAARSTTRIAHDTVPCTWPRMLASAMTTFGTVVRRGSGCRRRRGFGQTLKPFLAHKSSLLRSAVAAAAA